MYLNQIRISGVIGTVFVTSDEVFTPHNPTFKAIQEALERMGWKPQDNHNFTKDGHKLALLHDETEHVNLKEWAYHASGSTYYKGEFDQLIEDIYYYVTRKADPIKIKEFMK